MTGYIFQEGHPLAGFNYSFEPWLFHQEQHLHLQSIEGLRSFYIVNEKRHTIDAHIHFHIQNEVAWSPFKAPFGSVQYAAVPPLVLFQFMEYVHEQLKDKNVRQVLIKNPPDIYDPPRAALLNVFLLNLGYQVECVEVDTVLHVDNEFNNNLDSWEKRKLRQSLEAGLHFAVGSVDDVEVIYNFIRTCRDERGYQLSMSVEEIKSTVEIFPERFHIFTIKDGDQLAAASISIHVGNNILYNFYSAHARVFDRLSPMVMVLEGMIRYGKEKRFSLIDLGTSAIQGQPNFDLLDFKLRLGGIPNQKVTLKKILSA